MFDSSLKIGLLKRYVRSSSKWCVIPDDFELYNVFKYGIDSIKRIQEMTLNPFWKDVLNSLKILGKKEGFIFTDNILLTPLWRNPQLRLQIKKGWLDRGIQIIYDVLDTNRETYSLKKIEEKYNLKTNFGGLKLHNLELFDSSLKIGLLKRYVRSSSKWCVIPDDFELYNVFEYGIDSIERIQEMTLNPFWKDVLNSLKILGKKEGFIFSDNILLTPLWRNPQLRLQIKKGWLDRGIQIIYDVLDTNREPYSLKKN